MERTREKSPWLPFKDDRGDVPGWVLITLMTAAMVVLLWTVAAPALTAVFDQAMNKVASF